MTIQKYNLPDKDDPQWPDKVVDLIRSLFEHADNPIKSHTPLASAPEDGKQHGDMWFDSSDQKFKVHTENGIKTVKFE